MLQDSLEEVKWGKSSCQTPFSAGTAHSTGDVTVSVTGKSLWLVGGFSLSLPDGLGLPCSWGQNQVFCFAPRLLKYSLGLKKE